MASEVLKQFMEGAIADQQANIRRAGEFVEEFGNRLRRVIGRPSAKLDDLDLWANVDPATVPAKPLEAQD